MDLGDLAELVVDLLLEGALEGAASRRVPRGLRVLLAGAAVLLMGGLSLLLFAAAVFAEGNGWAQAALAAVSALIAVWLRRFVSRVREGLRPQREDHREEIL